MRRVGIDHRHIDQHAESHRRFLQDVKLLKASDGNGSRRLASNMLGYLVHWLTYHILGQDQNMARQIESVRSGVDAAKAFEAEEKEQGAAIEPLLTALNGLLSQLFSRNRELVELNRSLEQRVAERTRELSKANDKLKTLSLHDSLTGLSNRRHAMMQLKTLWADCGETGKPLSVLMIDADNFKAVNDNHGHDAGDAVLVTLARALQQSVRTDDLVSRLGGDEFLMLCPSTDLNGALEVAEQLRQRVAGLRVPAGNDFWDSSISIGVAVRTPSMNVIEDLIKAADQSVYRAKKAGKNCIRLATPTPADVMS